MKQGMNDAQRVARVYNEKHKQMEDEFVVQKTLEEKSSADYKKVRNKVFTVGERFGGLDVTGVQYAYGGKGMTLVLYQRSGVPNMVVSYPNYPSVGRSFEVDVDAMPKGFVWHKTNESAWEEELKKHKNDGNKNGRDNLDDLLGYED